jgi:hypothetical protein
MTMKSGVAALIATLTWALAAASLSGAATAATAAPRDLPAVAGVLLPTNQPITQASDISELGIVVGTAGPPQVASQLEDGTTPQRWIPLPRKGYIRQQLTLPTGATGSQIEGVNEFGEAAGSIGFGAYNEARAARWSISGKRSIFLGPAATATAASGQDQWIIGTGNGVIGSSTLIDRDGTRTELVGTPELANTSNVLGQSLGRRGTALLLAITGFGRVAMGRPVIWQDGATTALPVFSSYFVGPSCTSEMQPDGTVAYSGPTVGDLRAVIAIHKGGVPGTNVELPVPVDRSATLNCQTHDTLAKDGVVAGQLEPPNGLGVPVGASQAAIWRDGAFIPIATRDDEIGTRSIAVASGGRVLLESYPHDAATRYYLWQDGVRRPLTIPAGWSIDEFIKLTDSGVALANLRNNEGQIRPAVWRMGN